MAYTSTVGGVMSGYWAMGRLKTEIPPARVMMIDSTEANMGRSMKKRENTAQSSHPVWVPRSQTRFGNERKGGTLRARTPGLSTAVRRAARFSELLRSG